MESLSLPQQFEDFISQKLQKNCHGGRPHFLKRISKDKDPKDVVLEIVERCWLKGKSVGSTARKFKVKYLVIYRILQDLAPWKDDLISFVAHVPRRKVFYNRATDSSDYDTVQQFIKRSHRDEVKNYETRIKMALKSQF